MLMKSVEEGSRCTRMSPVPGSCRLRTELIFHALLAGLFNEGRVPPGSVLEAGGSLTGALACFAASLDRSRLVHAFEPSEQNQRLVDARFGDDSPNLRTHCARLGEATGTIEVKHTVGPDERIDEPLAKTRREVQAIVLREVRERVPVHTLDSLFVGPGAQLGGERLGLAHIDAAGIVDAAAPTADPHVYASGRAVLARDAPLVAIAIDVHANHSRTLALVRGLEASAYEVYVIEESCGLRADCRRLLAIPRARGRAFAGSPTLTLASASHSLVRVNSSSVLRVAYPCCALVGGPCCPSALSCCTYEQTRSWRRAKPDAPRYWRDTWFNQRSLVFPPDAAGGAAAEDYGDARRTRRRR
jgi:hypothetical protein